MHTQPAFNHKEFHGLYRGELIICWHHLRSVCDSKLLAVVPVTDVNEIELLWQLPCLFDKYRCVLSIQASIHKVVNDSFQCRAKPMEYISWLLGHEGEGSVLHHLKKK